MHNYFTYKRKYVNGVKTSSNIFDILPYKLTVNRPIVPPRNTTLAQTRETIFKEIKLKNYSPDRNDAWIAQQLRKQNKINVKSPSGYLFDTLKNIVYQTWNPDVRKIITHSGGYDSRILSTIILDLYLEHGSKWLGDVLFVETRGEAKEFKQIMKVQGWERNEQMIIHPVEYEHISFSFDNLRTRFSGYSAYPVNIWIDPLMLLKEKGIINGAYQHYTGFGAYYEKAVRNMKYSDFLIINNFYQLASFNFGGHVIMPFFFYDYLLAIKRCKSYIPKNLRTSEYICQHKVKYLDHVRRPTKKNIKRRKVNEVSKDTLVRVNYDYNTSDYGKKHPMRFTKDIAYSEQWAKWNISNFVETLKNKHKIII